MSTQPGWIEPRTTDLLHETLQEHMAHCDQCRRAAERKKRPKFGERSQMCAEYQKLVVYWMTAQMLDSTTE